MEQLRIDVEGVVADHLLQLRVLYLKFNQCLGHFELLFFTLDQFRLQIGFAFDYLVELVLHLLHPIDQLGLLVCEFHLLQVLFNQFLFKLSDFQVVVVCIVPRLHVDLVVKLDQLHSVLPQQPNGPVVIDYWEVHNLLAFLEVSHCKRRTNGVTILECEESNSKRVTSKDIF